MGDNAILRERMKALSLTQTELALLMNREIERLTGRFGTVQERTIHNLLSGVTRWPQTKQRAALEAVFGCRAEELGFTPRGASSPGSSPEQPVRRRNFVTSISGAAAAVAIPHVASQRSVGMSDVVRLRAGLETLGVLDDQRGGHAALESAALAGAKLATDAQQGRASERVRRRLFSVAADYTALAAWSCIDAHALDRAQQHLDRCMTLAGLAQDSTAQLRVWNSIAMLAHQRHRFTDAVAAAQAAQATSIARRDSLFGSLAHARTAIGHSDLGDRQAALRSLGYAQDALARSQEQPRPGWVAFYGPAELHALTAIVYEQLGAAEQSEGASHQALSTIPDQFRRNRALATARLALAQLHQGDIEQGCSTAQSGFDLMAGAPIPGRMRTLLGDFHRDLLTAAPSSASAREWADRMRIEWSRP